MGLVDRRAVQPARSDTQGTPVRALPTGLLLGIGIAGFLDETLFHQLLQWHNFYWDTDQHGRILSDGLFHAASTLVLLWGTVRLWLGRGTWTAPRNDLILAGILLGAGGFNLYDGIVQHAILHLHQVNEHVCTTPASRHDSLFGLCRNDVPYEIVWDLVALAIALAGWVRFRTARA